MNLSQEGRLHNFTSSTALIALLRCAAAVATARAKGQTLLPLPPGTSVSPNSPSQHLPDQLQLFEATVLTWTRQITHALRRPQFESLLVSPRLLQCI